MPVIREGELESIDDASNIECRVSSVECRKNEGLLALMTTVDSIMRFVSSITYRWTSSPLPSTPLIN